MDSVMDVVRYQRSILATPQLSGDFSVRANWGPQIHNLGGASLRKYIASYKGVTTYVTLSGTSGWPGVGVIPHLLNGPGPTGSDQSDFWTEIIKGMQAATQTL
jgi:hypothetical protein